MNFKESIDKIEERPDYPGMILVWRYNTGWPVAKNDLDAFCSHMDDWYSISCKSLSREEYIAACNARNIEPTPDSDIGGYGDTYGDFGMSHYHTVPKNRLPGIIATLKQARWLGMLSENPNIPQERAAEATALAEATKLERLKKTYPDNLQAWIDSVGGLNAIYDAALYLHANNSTQLRESNRHFEWLIGHSCMNLALKTNTVFPDWWGDWSETDPSHPLNRIAAMLADRRIEPLQGQVTYMGYGEDCGDDVRKNLKEWLNVD